uniref:Uncharacterized protein n=1 Tax=Amphiprion percula TaxID=161767 RepID=A0A3P8TJD9_AMPPE
MCRCEQREAGQWSTGLCEYKVNRFTQRQWMIVDCCCFALCCLPVFTCKVTSAVGACPCLPLLDCIGCVPPASLAMRASVRQRYGIQVLSAGPAQLPFRRSATTCQMKEPFERQLAS